MSNKEQLDDEFFGNLDDDTYTRNGDENTNVDLDTAESSAVERQFHTLGFHEAYEETKDLSLQEGFEAGYRENFDAAERIGRLLGECAAKTRLPAPMQEQQPKAPTEDDRRVSRLIRKAITKTDGQADIPLDVLEQQVRDCIQETQA